MSSWKQRKSSVYSPPPNVWYEAIQQENPSQTLDGDSSLPETINNTTFTEEKRNKKIRASGTRLCISQQSLRLPKHGGTLGKNSVSYYCEQHVLILSPAAMLIFSCLFKYLFGSYFLKHPFWLRKRKIHFWGDLFINSLLEKPDNDLWPNAQYPFHLALSGFC